MSSKPTVRDNNKGIIFRAQVMSQASEQARFCNVLQWRTFRVNRSCRHTDSTEGTVRGGLRLMKPIRIHGDMKYEYEGTRQEPGRAEVWL